MKCPTCGHKTAILDMAVYVCRRCGTTIDAVGNVRVPHLIERCRGFFGLLQSTTADWSADGIKILVDQSGIPECLNLPPTNGAK